MRARARSLVFTGAGIFVWGAAAAAAAACGGSAFTSGPGNDGGPLVDGSVLDGKAADGPAGDGQPGDALPGEGGASDGGPPTMVVAGHVVDSRLVPVAGANVIIGGVSAKSGVDGGFKLSAPTPYTAVVTVAATAATHPTAFVFEGLTRADATLQLPGVSLPNVDSTAVTGNATFPVNGSVLVAEGVAWADLGPAQVIEGPNAVLLTGAPTPVSLSLPVVWTGTPTVAGTGYFLTWTNDATTGLPSDFTGLGSTQLSFTNGTGTAWNPSTSMPLLAAQLTTALGVTPGFSVKAVDVFLRYPATSAQAALIVGDTRGQASGTYTTPNISGAALAATLVEQENIDSGAGTAASIVFQGSISTSTPGSLALTFTPPPTATAPPGGASVDTSTTFSWTAFGSGAAYVTVWQGNQLSDPTYVVLGTATSSTIPDLGPIGMKLPSGEPYSWYVEALAPYATLDAMCGPNGFMTDLFAVKDGRGPTVDQTFGSSHGSVVTTK